MGVPPEVRRRCLGRRAPSVDPNRAEVHDSAGCHTNGPVRLGCEDAPVTAVPDPIDDPARGVLAALDPEQRAVAEALRGPVCVLAGAGTGKTRAITHRIAHAVLSGAVPAGHILAVTFTARAAAEMRARLHILGLGAAGAGLVQARTFHSAALRQLGYFHPRVVGGPLPPLVDSKARLVQLAANRHRLTLDRVTLRDVTSEIEWAKSMLVAPDAYAAAAAKHARRPPLDAAQIARIASTYEDVK